MATPGTATSAPPRAGEGPLATALYAALTLVLGFGVAQATGARWLGGIVLVLGWAWCARQWWRTSGVRVAVLLTLVFLALFAFSHLLATWIGAWPSVLAVAVAMATTSWALTRRA